MKNETRKEEIFDNLLLIEQVIDLNNSIVLYIFVLKIEYLVYIFFDLIKDVYSKNKNF